MNFTKESLIKSPLNYTGGKYKLLNQILPYIPDGIDTFYDLFAGGCNVGVNVKANKIVCNDIESNIINMMNYFKDNDKEVVFKVILKIIKHYDLLDSTIIDFNGSTLKELRKYDKEKYLTLRKDYNDNNSCFNKNLVFYTLCCYSFSNQIRFNSKGQFNMPYGQRDFNKNMRNNLSNFLNRLNEINIEFNISDFRNIDVNKLNSSDFVYCDPPYLVTCANYNEQNGWNITLEEELLNFLDILNCHNIKFALSNVLENKGKSNDILKEWCKKYNVHYLNHSYANCNYHVKDRNKDSTVEVLITNY